MSRFFVGQRVRVTLRTSLDFGKETIIRRKRLYPDGTPGLEVDLPLLFGGVEGYTHAIYESHELEPIIDPGHQPAELSISELLPFLRDKVYE